MSIKGRRRFLRLAGNASLAAALARCGGGHGQQSGASGAGGAGCSQQGTSIVVTVPPAGNIFNWYNSNPKGAGSFGSYIVAVDDWNSVPATLWINDQTCWGVTTTLVAEGGGIKFAPNVTRGWIYNAGAMSRLSDSGTYPPGNWTIKSGMGIQLSSLSKARARWSISIPTAPYPASRWDALMDVFFHTMQLPLQDGTGWYPEVDLQIIQCQMDSGFYKAICNQAPAQRITLGGVQYVVVIDIMGPFNQTGGHTITMFTRPTDWSDSTGHLWGKTDCTHDLHAIINYWMGSNPMDDGGQPMKYAHGGWSPNAGLAVTSSLLNSSWYFTAVNGDFEIDYGDGVSPWITKQFWVSVQNEPDGP